MKKRAASFFMIFSMLLLLFSNIVMADQIQLNLTPWVKLTSPVGGENLLAGSKQNITWQQSKSGGYVSLTYSVDSGATFTKIGEVFDPKSSNSFEWTVPNDVTTKGRIAVNWRESPGVWYVDSSPTDFTVYKLMGLNPIVIVTSPVAPTDLKATALSANDINLAWKDNANNESGYKVERKITNNAGSFIEIATLDPNTTSYMDKDLNPLTNYTYRVLAYNAQGNSPFSNQASATTSAQLILVPIPSVPTAPTQLKAEVKSSTKITLNWKDNATNEIGYRIERKIKDSNFEEIDKVDMNITSYEDLNLLPGTNYTYRVRAQNNIGYSGYSNEEVAMTIENQILQPQPIPQPQVPADAISMRLYINKSEYYVNNTLLTMDTVPIINNGRTLLPIRYVAEALGATVAWNGPEQKITIQFKDTTIELWINKNEAKVNGIKQQIDPMNPNVVPVIIPPGRTMLPLRFIAENLGSSVDWEPVAQEVTLTYPKK